LTPSAGRAVANTVYGDVLEDPAMPALARHFSCAALVAEEDGKQGWASQRYMEAAWACDDAGAADGARICRQRAAEMLALAIQSGQAASQNPVVHGVRADLLRRAGLFNEAVTAVEAAEAVLTEDSEHYGRTAAVLDFIRELALAENDAPHTVGDAFLIR